MNPQRFSVAYKRLTSVEINPSSSNQHEFQGVQAFRSLLGDSQTHLVDVPMIMLSDEKEPKKHFTNLTWYDARENNPRRSSEFRLFYSITPESSPNDLLTLIRDDRGSEVQFAILIAEGGSTWESQLLHISGINNVGTHGVSAGS